MAAAGRPLFAILKAFDARIFLSDFREIFAVSAAGLLGVSPSHFCVRIFGEKTSLSWEREISAVTAA